MIGQNGNGLDLEGYLDKGVVNWISGSENNIWINTGSDFYTSPSSSQVFETGLEDLFMDITPAVEYWITGTITNRGLIIKLTGSLETGSVSYYTKKFFARSSEFFFKRPIIEAQWDNDVIKDRRTNFFISSALAPASDNLNTIYLYNRIRGRLQNIPAAGSGTLFLSLFSGSNSPSGSALILHNLTSSVTGRFCFDRRL